MDTYGRKSILTPASNDVQISGCELYHSSHSRFLRANPISPYPNLHKTKPQAPVWRSSKAIFSNKGRICDQKSFTSVDTDVNIDFLPVSFHLYTFLSPTRTLNTLFCLF
jgi:hypothetical protein